MSDSTPAGAGFARVREYVTDALRYWELRRLLYNGLLAVIVIWHFGVAWPESKSFLKFDNLLGVFLLAVLANVAFSAAYVADLFIQFSGFRESRSVWRLVILGVGLAFAGVLTHFFASGMFANPSGL